jgi:thioesterase domain-containing protein
LSESDTILGITTLSFDIATAEIFLPLVVGARLALVSREIAVDGARLLKEMRKSEITVMQATPATWRLVLGAGWNGEKSLTIFSTGEALPRDLADRLLERGKNVWNLYGPTETTIWSTLHQLDGTAGPVLIGRPIANTQIHVLDSQLRSVPAGEPGELCIGGHGLARGYRGRPALAAEKFIPDPFSDEPGARLYRTGDLARFLPDGNLECLGRIDHQVKIRGFRIELGEIEAVIAKVAGVREAVVAACEDVHGDKRLVAYVVPSRVPGPTATGLRRYLKERLPEYMVPSAFVSVTGLPLTPNGKVDRKALPAPDSQRPELETPLVAPRNELERTLVGIWEKVLDIRPIGVRDNVFELGLHSLTAARLFAEIEKGLGRELPSGLVFRAPTVEQMANHLQGAQELQRWASLVSIQANGSRPPFFCIHGGAGTVLLFHDLARRLGSDQPLYALQSRGIYGGAPAHGSVEEMADAYLREIRTVQPEGPYYLGGYCFGGLVAFEMARLLVEKHERVAALVLFNAPSPSYTKLHEDGPPARVPVQKVANGQTKEAPVRRYPAATLLPRLKRALGWRIRHLNRRAREFCWMARRSFYLTLRFPIPESGRGDFFIRNNHVAELAYVPRPYRGSMVLFRADDLYDDPYLGWDGLADQGIEVHEIAGDHLNQRTLMHEPYIAQVAARLETILCPAQVVPHHALDDSRALVGFANPAFQQER